ncbi:MAG: SDR family oxidoreductase [Bacteroidetes Order II. Incertae sedis bacterium]|nr:SDR family oxidoreductase [Bacteroidetes Order II. bacterium]
MNIQNRYAIVTGASRGLGAAISDVLAAAGTTVFGLGRNEEDLMRLKEKIGDSFRPIVCDVRSSESVKGAMEQVFLQSGDQIDILINNAGLGKFGAIEQMTDEDWEVQVDTNLKGVFLCTRAVVPHMKRQNAQTGFGGHIINIASVAGLVGNPNIGIYNATKFGLRGFSDSLMLELRNDGIKVTCVYPGSIETAFFKNTGFPSGSSQKMHPEEIAQTILHLLQTTDNYLISEIVLRPLRPKGGV